MWCEMTAAGSQNPVLLQDKMFSRKYIPSQDFRRGHQPQTLHKVKNKPRIYDFVKKKHLRKKGRCTALSPIEVVVHPDLFG